MKKWKDGKYSDGMEIRAHHILCMHGFQGYGYNRDFIRNMADILAYLKSHPSCSLQLVVEVDIICRQCPHQHQGECHKTPNSNQIMEKMDLMVLKKLKLEEGEEYTAHNIYLRLKEVIQSLNDLREICGECFWKDKCGWFSSDSSNNLL